MANVAVPTATTYLGGVTAATGLQATMVTACTSIASGSSFTFAPTVMVNNVLTPVVLWVIVGASGAGNFVFTNTQTGGSNLTIAVANSSSYLLGPFDPAVYGASTGVVTCTPTVFTGNSVGAFLLAQPYTSGTLISGLASGQQRALHNPLEQTAGTADF